MQKTVYIFMLLLFVLAIITNPIAAQKTMSDSELLERLVRLEEGQKQLVTRIDDLRDSNNQRFNDLRDSNNQRFDAINKRFDDLFFWLQLVSGALVLILGGMIAQWMLMWKRMSKVEAKVEDRLIIGYREEEMNKLKQQLKTLQAKIAASVS